MYIPFTSQVTELVNRTEGIILLFECEAGEPNGRSCRPIELTPQTTTEIQASRFISNHDYSKKPRTVRFRRIDSIHFEKDIFRAQDFLIYHRIVFQNPPDGGAEGPLLITKFREPGSGGILAGIRRTRLVRYFLKPEAPQIPRTNHLQSDLSDSSRALIPGYPIVHN